LYQKATKKMPTRKSSQKSNSTWVLLLGLMAVQSSVQKLQAFVVVTPTTVHRDQRYHASISSSNSSPTRYQNQNHGNGNHREASAAVARLTSSRRYLAARTPDLDSTDPFAVLGLEPSPSLDKKEIKRAYKRLALKFHPDVATTKDSPKAEKKAASDKFAKINWAYETLSGKREPDKTYASKSTSTSSTQTGGTGTGSSGYKPPHRRTEAYSTTVGRSTDWRDYMPKYDTADDDKKYDAGGDSFGSIFSDLFNGASSVADYTAGARGGIFTSFIEFLESNVDGYSVGSGSSSGMDDDAQLRILLQTGTLQEIGDEMDDTELVVQQLGSKLNSVTDELVMLDAEVKVAIKYMEKLDLEERVAELQARKTIVETYLKKARKRLLALQTRYKQLIVNGDNDVKAGGGRSSTGTSSAGSTGNSRQSPPGTSSSSSSRNDSYSAAGYRSTSSSTSSTGSSSTGTSDSSRSSTSRTGTGSSTSKDKEDAWKSDSFGSFGRGRSSGSSSRQRASRSRTPRTTPEPTRSSSTSSSSSSSTGASDSSRNASSSRDPTSTRQTTTQGSSTQDVPPHRRQTAKPQDQDDSRRMRDLKVDDEFEKLKKELGL
jgi:curved DNA-binding protein CbpA